MTNREAQGELPHEHDGDTALAVGNLIYALEAWKATDPRTAPPAWKALVQACAQLVSAAQPEQAQEAVACPACGQTDVGQYGEYPCQACGLPKEWGNDPLSTSPETSATASVAGLSVAAPAVELKRPDCFEFAMDFLGCPEDDEVRAYVEALESALTTHREHSAAQQERQEVSGLAQAIDALIDKHGTLRAVARATRLDVGYLSRLHKGEKENPSDETLQALGIERVFSYRSALAAQAQKEKP
jgi:hypothetical protein